MLMLFLSYFCVYIESVLRDLHSRYGPIITLRVGPRLVIFISDRRLAHTALITHGAIFAGRPAELAHQKILTANSHNITGSTYGLLWRLLRRNLAGEALHSSRVKFYSPAQIGMDKDVWDKPTEFRPERFLKGGEGEKVDITGTKEIKMMPFGVGRRICPGSGVAMLYLEYFVANLLKEFEWKEIEGKEVDLAEKMEFTTVMKNPLEARLVPRNNIHV
ncbi:hypothetical protein LUZ60_014732 [Juncus effusus]|nr:hypothetical protein LUZ60_014732 [Juncus effusus]